MKTLMLIIATLWVTQTLADFRVTDPVFSPPHWTTATRPVCTAGGGCVGYNTDLDKLETWNGTAWVISGSGSSDILGPVASATGTVAIYADDTGKLLSSTLYTIPTDPGNVGDVLRISSAGVAGATPTVIIGLQNDGQVTTDTTQLYGWNSPFASVLPGDIVTISSSTLPGDRTVVSVLSLDTLQLSGAIATGTSEGGIGYSINRGGAGSGTPGVAEWQAISSSKIVDADGNTSVDTDVTGTGNADTIIFSNNGIETARFVPGTAGTPTETPVIASGTGSTQADLTHLYDFTNPFGVVLPGDIVTISSGTIGDYTVVNVISPSELQVDGAIATGTFQPDSIVYSINRISGGGASSGSLGIGTDTPNPGAILDLSSDSKAFLLPRLTNAAMNAIPSPLNGMQVYNTDQKKVYFYNGSGWEPTGVASALFNLGITDASSIATPSNPPAPPTGYKNGDFYIVNGFGAVAPMFFPSVTTAGTGDYLIFDDGGDGIGGAAGDTWEKIAFSDVGQITRNGTTTDGNLMIWDQDNTNSAKDLGISALDLLTMGLNAPGPNFAVVSAGAGDKTTKLTPYTLPEDTGGVGYVLTTDGVGTATWVDIGTIAGSGNVVGPATSTDNSLALYDGATGKLIKSTPYTMPTVACADGEILSSDGTNFVCTPVGAVSKTVYNANGYAAVAGSGTPTETPIIASGTGATSATTTQLVDNTSPFSVVLPGDIVTISSSTLPGDRTVVSVIGANTLQLDGDIATQTFEQDIAYSINRMEAGGGTSTSGFYFSNVRVPTNSTCYTVTNNSTEGFYFTVNEKCVFTVSFTGSNISGLLDAGFVLNPTAGEAAGSFKDIPFGKKLCNTAVQGVTGSTGSCSFQWEGTVGEKIQLIGSAGMTPDTPEKFAVSILGFSPGSDIGISTAAVTPPTEVVVVSQRSTGGASPSARMVLFDNSAPFSGVLIGDTVKITAPAGGGSETTVVAQNGGGQSGEAVGGDNHLSDSTSFSSVQVGDTVRVSSCTDCNLGDFEITSVATEFSLIVDRNIRDGGPAATETVVSFRSTGATESALDQIRDYSNPFGSVRIGDIVYVSSSTLPATVTVTNIYSEDFIQLSGNIAAGMYEQNIAYSIDGSRVASGTINDIEYSIVRAATGTGASDVVAGDYLVEAASASSLTLDAPFFNGSSTVTNITYEVTRMEEGTGGGGGTGDVVGPASSVNNVLAVFDGTTGKLIKEGSGFKATANTLSSPNGGYFEAKTDSGQIATYAASVVRLAGNNGGLAALRVNPNYGVIDLTLPNSLPSTPGQALTSDIYGTLSWADIGGGGGGGITYNGPVNGASSGEIAAFTSADGQAVRNQSYLFIKGDGMNGGILNLMDVTNTYSAQLSPHALSLISASGTSAQSVSIQAPYNLAASWGMMLPLTAPTANQVLTAVSNVTGPVWQLGWADPSTATGGGSGDVVGPAVSTDNHVAVFDGTTGKLIKDGNMSIPGTPGTGGSILLNPSGTSGISLIGPNNGNAYNITFPMLAPTANQILQSDAAGNLSWIDTPGGAGGSGDVVGPMSSQDNTFAFFDGPTGKLLKSMAPLRFEVEDAGMTAVYVADGSMGGQKVGLKFISNMGDILRIFQNNGQAGSYNITFPAGAPAANQILESDASGNLSWIATPASDARLKKNVSPMSRDFLADIMALTPSSFEWTEKTRPVGVQLGLIAQDVMKVIPEAVYAKSSGTLDLNDRALIATLIGAMKQQQAQIEALKLEIQELKK